MRLRARLGTASLVMPDGGRRVLLHIPDWDDSWQNRYDDEPIQIAPSELLTTGLAAR
jgi:hypothetical protein